ncbi:hypothetical protein [Streptomyces cheonanensis]
MDGGQRRYRNPAARAWRCDPAPVARVRAFHRGLPGYRETPLVRLDGGVFVKDEAVSFGSSWIRPRRQMRCIARRRISLVPGRTREMRQRSEVP